MKPIGSFLTESKADLENAVFCYKIHSMTVEEDNYISGVDKDVSSKYSYNDEFTDPEGKGFESVIKWLSESTGVQDIDIKSEVFYTTDWGKDNIDIIEIICQRNEALNIPTAKQKTAYENGEENLLLITIQLEVWSRLSRKEFKQLGIKED